MNTCNTTGASSTYRQVSVLEPYYERLAEYTNLLASSRFWHICALGNEEPCGLFDAETGIKYPPLQQLDDFLKSALFLSVRGENNNKLAIFDTHSRLLWHNDGKNRNEYDYSSAVKNMEQYQTPGLNNWRLPSNNELKGFYKRPGNPHVANNLLMGKSFWFTKTHVVRVDNFDHYSPSNPAYMYACSSQWQHISNAQLMVSLADKQLYLVKADDKQSLKTKSNNEIGELISSVFIGVLQALGKQHLKITSNNEWSQLSGEALLRELYVQDLCLRSVDDNKKLSSPLSILHSLDWIPCRLPLLEKPRLTDPNKGLWELWGANKSELEQCGLVARNPELDIKLHNVAIDFGTSSTVVAYCDEHGGRQLLRIGVRDFYQAPEASHYENPTVLEVLDFQQFSSVWQEQTYRPALDWNWLRASHEARESFRSNAADTRVIASILPRIKQWAMRSEKERVLLTDYQGQELRLPALTERNPVCGEVMRVDGQYPFDPVELYAWYLGMAINWRERGLYLKYHMTFPAKYERDLKDKILASFRRGLQRSLPTTLVNQPEVLRQFEVRELASEPSAYAAAALPQLELTLNDDGIAYAVFDFGGGTTDFDFGLWRWATEEEENEGYQQVFESLHSSGDNFLGGENLLEHLVYSTFQENLDVCREHKIHFTRPLDGERFTGDEAFVQKTQAAQTNTVMLAAALRPFMESDDGTLQGQLKIKLLDVNGQPKQCELTLDHNFLNDLLEERITRGLEAFSQELAYISEQFADKTVHVLLAGNGSRSRHLARLIEENVLQDLLADFFDGNPPSLEIHRPLVIDENNHHAPTAKTGVALGLLRLCPGEGVKLIDRVRSSCRDEAPFRYYVGGVRRGQFDAKLTPTCDSEVWKLLGVMPQKVFKLCYSQSPRARGAIAEGDPELLTRRIDFPAAPLGAKIFVRAIQPTVIELAVAEDEIALKSNVIAYQKIDLDTGLMTN